MIWTKVILKVNEYVIWEYVNDGMHQIEGEY
jgi:hypothetical protein